MSLGVPAVDAEGTLGRRTFAASWEEAGGPAAGLLLAAQARVQAARQAEDEQALCAALREEGQQLLSAGQPQAALGFLFEAVALYDPAALEEQARVWQLAARAQLALAAEAEAREYLGLGLRLMQEAGHLSGAIDLLEDLAELEAGSGDQVRALAHLEAHLGLRRELGEPLGLCQTLLAVGKARLRQTPPQTGAAQRDLEAAAQLARETGSASLLAQAQGHLAAAHGLRGELDEAEALLIESAQGFVRLGDVARLAQVRLGQGRIQAERGEVLSALDCAAEALGLSRRSASSSVEAQALLLLSTQAEAAGDLQAALAHHRAYHELSLRLHRAGSEGRAQQIAARVGLEGSRQQADVHRQRGSVLEGQVAERTAQLEATQLEMLELLASAAECRDAPLGLHASWVGEASSLVAAELGWSAERARDLGLAARLHDIGKLAIPDAVLLKEGALSEEERALMQTHTILGARLLRHSTSPLLHLAADIALSHHERWDGGGYPAGSAGLAIPQAGRIVAVVDAYDALLSERSYKAAWTAQAAAAHLQANAGQHFDPEVVAAVVALQSRGQLPPRSSPPSSSRHSPDSR